VEEAICILGVELAEILKVLKSLIPLIFRDKSYDMEVIITTLVHN